MQRRNVSRISFFTIWFSMSVSSLLRGLLWFVYFYGIHSLDEYSKERRKRKEFFFSLHLG